MPNTSLELYLSTFSLTLVDLSQCVVVQRKKEMGVVVFTHTLSLSLSSLSRVLTLDAAKPALMPPSHYRYQNHRQPHQPRPSSATVP
ncbi:unnamed protein product [Camellia sinensis]